VKIVIVGGVAAGMSAAARARRLDERADIVVLERDDYVSFANCGLPYYLGGDIENREDLLLQTPAGLAATLALDVRTGSDVLAVNRDARTVRVRVARDGQREMQEYDEPYDRLVLATGAKPIRPPLPGIDHPRVRTLRTVGDVDVLVDLVGSPRVRSALVVGGGYIGVEAAEALINRGLQVTLVELADQVLGPLDPEMAQEVSNELRRRGVDLRTGVGVTAFTDAPAAVAGFTDAATVRAELSDGSSVRADLVLLAIGVVPDSKLAREAGLDVTARGAVLVNRHQQTSDPVIYAAGDCVQVVDTVTGAGVVVPLAGPANRQGRIAADHIAGRSSAYHSTQGTAIVKVFDLTAGGTGANEKSLRRMDIDYRVIYVHPNGHAGYFPGTAAMQLKLIFAPDDGKILGAQVVGRDGVDKRIDVLAVALRAGLTVFDLEELELAYAPPYGSAKDPVNMAGFQAANLLRGDVAFWYPRDWAAMPADTQVVDVRTPAEHAHCALPGSVNIPLQVLRGRLAELDPAHPVRLYCASGFRSYLSYRILVQEGFLDVSTLSGGTMTMQLAEPGLCRQLGGLDHLPGPVVSYTEDTVGCRVDAPAPLPA
jgi:NADPH-dependent 2,4-dienoyl-CoA reductase/sulfur reductase-like enzyme/rhodanese-related sulfurtransferase